MATLNKVLLMGNLTRDPELRYIPSGTAVTSFSIAVNRAYTSPTGEKKEEVCFIRIVVWGRMAEVCGEYLSKGSPIFVEGRLQSRSWEAQDGQKRNTIEVIASNVQFLRGSSQGANQAQADSVKAPGQNIPEIDMDNQAGEAAPSDSSGADNEVPF